MPFDLPTLTNISRIRLLLATAMLVPALAAQAKDAAPTASETIKANIKKMLNQQKDIAPLSDIPVVASAKDATLTETAYYAWQEFISLNWPAVVQTGALNDREKADVTKKFGDTADGSSSAYPALVWETYRHKVEIYPGQGFPNGFIPTASKDFGYDQLPEYIYNEAKASINVLDTAKTPWVNLDEASQIGTNQMYSGLAPGQELGQGPGRLVLFLAKANRTEYQYVASRGWWNHNKDNIFSPARAIKRTSAYVRDNKKSPTSPPVVGSFLTQDQQEEQGEMVSFPSGTFEIKTAWRVATPAEKAAYNSYGYVEGYHASTVRYYLATNTKQDGATQYVAKDDLGVMLGLHIIHKTPTAPYFIFATFEHKSNIRDASGSPIEDASGSVIGTAPTSITTSEVTSIPSQVKRVKGDSGKKQKMLTLQTFSPDQNTESSYSTNKQSFFVNTFDSNLASDKSHQPAIGVDKRRFPIPTDVINVNKDVHKMIEKANPDAGNPWGNYRLTNVQWKPLTKSAGTVYSGSSSADQATYYTSNSMIETNHILSEFSGQFSGVGNTITDFETSGKSGTVVKKGVTYQNGAVTGNAFHNVYAGGDSYLMGGCMGCHGNQQVKGNDFSFIFASPVESPDSAVNTYPITLE